MKRDGLYLSSSSSLTKLLRFMLSTYDGVFVITTAVIYILWGVGISIDIFQGNWVGVWGLFLMPMLMLVTFIWHRKDTYIHDKGSAFYCFVSEIAIAGIPFYRTLRDML